MKNLVIPVAVLSAVGMMIFPLPGFLLDFLLAANIAFSLALLVNALYVRDVNTFSSLPTLLLLATLFRLSLNISTTRQLLSYGSAPEIITAFGNFVVTGNLAVGIVIFLILSIVQFMVIAKGAERVAEVSARFTLDAMPGKQMAIDADMRAGFLSASEAKDKRLELQRESKLYGALDGAMKFIKGDAIAGLLITAVNITAGILIGVAYHDLSFSEAVARFTLFTVGDGLVSQIPAILVSVAAGIVVTQVGDKEERFIGTSILSQLGSEPQAVTIVAILMLLFSLAPGLPAVPFVFGGVLLLVAAALRVQNLKELAKNEREKQFSPRRYSGFVLQMGPAAMKLLANEGIIASQAAVLRNSFFEKWGLILPEISFDLDNSRSDNTVTFHLNSHSISEIKPPEVAGNFGNKIVEAIKLYSDLHKQEFIDDTLIRKLFEIHGPVVEDLLNDLVPDVVSVTELSGLIKELISDDVSAIDLNTILQAIAEHRLLQSGGPSQLSKFCGQLIENDISRLAYIRIKLKRTISKTLTPQGGSLQAWLLDPATDAVIAEAISTHGIDLLELNAMLVRSFKEAIDPKGESSELLLSSYKTREYLVRLFEEFDLNLKVVAAQEIDATVEIEIRGSIGQIDEDLSSNSFAEIEPPELLM